MPVVCSLARYDLLIPTFCLSGYPECYSCLEPPPSGEQADLEYPVRGGLRTLPQRREHRARRLFLASIMAPAFDKLQLRRRDLPHQCDWPPRQSFETGSGAPNAMFCRRNECCAAVTACAAEARCAPNLVGKLQPTLARRSRASKDERRPIRTAFSRHKVKVSVASKSQHRRQTTIAANITIDLERHGSVGRAKINFMRDDKQITSCGCLLITGSALNRCSISTSS